MRRSILALVLLAAAPAAARAQRSIKPFSVVTAPGGALEPGTYACRQQYNPAGYTYKQIDLTDPSHYAWRGSRAYPGGMRYDAKTGAIRFTSGKLAGGFRALYGRRADGRAIFVLADRELEPRADAYDYCVKREEP